MIKIVKAAASVSISRLKFRAIVILSSKEGQTNNSARRGIGWIKVKSGLNKACLWPCRYHGHSRAFFCEAHYKGRLFIVLCNHSPSFPGLSLGLGLACDANRRSAANGGDSSFVSSRNDHPSFRLLAVTYDASTLLPPALAKAPKATSTTTTTTTSFSSTISARKPNEPRSIRVRNKRR